VADASGLAASLPDELAQPKAPSAARTRRELIFRMPLGRTNAPDRLTIRRAN